MLIGSTPERAGARKAVPSPQEEAVALFFEVLRDLTSGAPDLKACLRKCFLACQLLGWADSRDWFARELGGYPATHPLPPHRIVVGELKWRVPSLEMAVVRTVEQEGRTSPPEKTERATLEVR